MNSRRDRILRASSSIAIGIMAFCLTFSAAMILGVLLLRPQPGEAFFSSQELILFLISAVIAVVVAIRAGVKYSRHVDRENELENAEE